MCLGLLAFHNYAQLFTLRLTRSTNERRRIIQTIKTSASSVAGWRVTRTYKGRTRHRHMTRTSPGLLYKMFSPVQLAAWNLTTLHRKQLSNSFTTVPQAVTRWCLDSSTHGEKSSICRRSIGCLRSWGFWPVSLSLLRIRQRQWRRHSHQLSTEPQKQLNKTVYLQVTVQSSVTMRYYMKALLIDEWMRKQSYTRSY